MAGASGPVHVQECEKQCKRVGDGDSADFGVRVVDHQGLVFIAILVIIVLEALQGIPHRFSLGAYLERRPYDQCLVYGELLL